MEGEDMARARLGIAHIAEQGLGAGAFVIEEQRRCPGLQMIGNRRHVGVGLLGDAAQCDPFRLRLDDAAGLAIDEEQVVAGSGGQRILAHGNAEPGAQIHVLAILNQPTRLGQQLIDP
jgi:hypothetical protein